jgi:hypothetical protein
VRDNVFDDVTYGIRVEDDRTTVEANTFTSEDAAHLAVILGTPVRTAVLGLPVDGTRVVGNHAEIAGSKNPYRWVHGQVNTTFEDNWSFDRPVGLCEGVPPARGPFVMAIAVVPADPNDPPTGPAPVLPPPEPLPPCPIACAAGGTAMAVGLGVYRLATPPGDDRLVLRGRVVLPYPFDPPLDPIETGVGVLVTDATGAHVLDALVPGGAYDPGLGAGWKRLRDGASWRYRNRGESPPAGIRTVTIRDRSRRQPGTLQFRVVGTRGSYPVVAGSLPLSAVFTVDPPTAETGQCADVSFAAGGGCAYDGKRVRCR